MRISSPEKVARLLEKVGQIGIPLIIRATSSPATAVKARAIPLSGSIRESGFRMGNISDRGVEFLTKNAAGGVQIEFVLMSAKVVFYSTISHISLQGCIVLLPSYLVSIERRKDARYPVFGNARAFLSIDSWQPDPSDLATAPFFESSKDLASLIPVGDVSVGGLSLVTRFPSACRVLDRGSGIEAGQFYLPMMSPMPVEVSIRWCKRLKEAVHDVDGRNRIVRTYKFGIQLVNPYGELLKSMQMFIQKVSQADAI